MDTGGFVGPQRATGEARGLFLFETMKQAGYAATSFCPDDMRLGRELLLALADNPDLPVVSANLYDQETGERVLPPSVITERAGIRIGITAVAVEREGLDGVAEEIGFRYDDPAERLPEVVRELDAEADLVVLLAQMKLEAAKELVLGMSGQIDIVVLGGQKTGRGGRVFPESGGAVYVVGGNRGQALGLARVALDGRRIEAIVGEEMVLSRDYPENPEVLASVKEFQGNLNELMKEHAVAIARDRRAPDGHNFLGVENCAGCHREEYKIWLDTPHSDAFQTLVAADSEALPECFMCHVTGYGDPVGYTPYAETDLELINVQCEVCHGKGTAHARDGSYGKSLLMESCGNCHDPENSPDFDPETYWLMIEH